MSEPRQLALIFPDKEDAESRRSKRRRMIKTGDIIYKHLGSLMSCRVMDLSDVGAKIQPDDPAACPDQFVLHFKSGDAYHCEVIWRQDKAVGVRFTGPAEFDPEYKGPQ